MESKQKMSLQEATIKTLYDQLDDTRLDDVSDVEDYIDGVVDNVLVVTDPQITEAEYEEVIERAQEIVDGTPEGQIPFSEDYIGEYAQTCPLCGMTFIEDHILEGGTPCPICLGEPESFIMVGKLETDEQVADDLGLGEDIEKDKGELTPEQPVKEDEVEDEPEVKEEEVKKESKEMIGGNTLKESKELNYISKEELDKIPEEYKTTIKQVAATARFRGEDPKVVMDEYTKLGYTENDMLILSLGEKGTILKPVKVKEEVKEAFNKDVTKMDFISLEALVDEKIKANATDKELNDLVEEIANNEVITTDEYTTLLNKIQDIRRIDEGVHHKIEEDVDWGYFKKFDEITDKYMPDSGEGDTLASQVVTAVNKLVYKWYNDGDVYDNTAYLQGWANDISDCANWLEKYCSNTNGILDKIFSCRSESEYTFILRTLCDRCLDEKYLETISDQPKQGSIYDCNGPYKFVEPQDEEDEEYWEQEDEEF